MSIILEMSATASIMIFVVVAIRKLFARKMSSTVMLLLWAMVLVRLCLPFTFTSPIHLAGLIPKKAEPMLQSMGQISNYVVPDIEISSNGGAELHQISQHVSTEENLQINSSEYATETIKQNNHTAKSNENHSSITDYVKGLVKSIPLWILFMGVWSFGVITIAIIFIRRIFRFKYKLRTCNPVIDKQVIQTISTHKSKLGIRKRITILECNFVRTPSVFGFIKPFLLLPSQFIHGMDRNNMSGILLHELCHIKRRDMLTNNIWLFAKVIHWFNPLVWIAYNLFQEDVELSCDQMVISRLSGRGRLDYGQSLIDSLRYANTSTKTTSFAAVSLFKKESKVKTRVTKIIVPQKKSRSSLIISFLLAMLMLVTCFTTACQPTPDEPIVINKGDGEMEKIIDNKPESQEKGSQGSQAQENIVKEYTDSFLGADEKVSININASVLVQEGNIPVVEVKPHYIDMEQIKTMAKVLFHGNTAYEPNRSLSKVELGKKILEHKKFISDKKAMEEYYRGDQVTIDEVKAMFEERIAEYEKMYQDAPETTEINETDWIFRPRSYYMDMVIFGGSLIGDDDETNQLKAYYNDSENIIVDSQVQNYDARLTVSNLETDSIVEHFAYFSTGTFKDGFGASSWDETDSEPMTMTKEEAVTMVQEALSQMGISNMELSECHASGNPKRVVVMNDPGLTKEEANMALVTGEGRDMDEGDALEKGVDVYGYHLTFTPVYEGVDTHDMNMFGDFRKSDQFGPSYQYEELHVSVHNGIITNLDWNAPMEEISVENENVPILSFEQALETFKKQIRLEYTLDKLVQLSSDDPDYDEYIDSIESGEINISDISLKLMRVRIKDKPGTYRMIPVWVFVGAEKLNIKGENTDTGDDDWFWNRSIPYAAINAIDGSIIDTSQGY